MGTQHSRAARTRRAQVLGARTAARVAAIVGLGFACGGPLGAGQAEAQQSGRYRIKMWVDITGSNDGFGDNTLECYGTLYVNGSRWWEIPRDRAGQNKRERGQVLHISDNFSSPLNAPFDFDLRIRDHDKGSSDDNVGLFNKRNLSLDSLSQGGERVYSWRSGQGESSRLHLRVERVN